MKILRTAGRLGRDMRRISAVSKQVRERLGSEGRSLPEMTGEELQDMDRLLQMASYILARHEDRRRVHSMMAEFVSMMDASSGQIGELDDQIQEMVLSAGGAVRGIDEARSRISAELGAGRVPQHTHGSGVE